MRKKRKLAMSLGSQPEEEDDVLKGLCDDNTYESVHGKKYSKEEFMRIVSKEALGYERVDSSTNLHQDWTGKGL